VVRRDPCGETLLRLGDVRGDGVCRRSVNGEAHSGRQSQNGNSGALQGAKNRGDRGVHEPLGNTHGIDRMRAENASDPGSAGSMPRAARDPTQGLDATSTKASMRSR
jgi:hypothetical protein